MSRVTRESRAAALEGQVEPLWVVAIKSGSSSANRDRTVWEALVTVLGLIDGLGSGGERNTCSLEVLL